MSGKEVNEEQFENISSIFSTLLVFHLEILGKEVK